MKNLLQLFTARKTVRRGSRANKSSSWMRTQFSKMADLKQGLVSMSVGSGR